MSNAETTTDISQIIGALNNAEMNLNFARKALRDMDGELQALIYVRDNLRNENRLLIDASASMQNYVNTLLLEKSANTPNLHKQSVMATCLTAILENAALANTLLDETLGD